MLVYVQQRPSLPTGFTLCDNEGFCEQDRIRTCKVVRSYPSLSRQIGAQLSPKVKSAFTNFATCSCVVDLYCFYTYRYSEFSGLVRGINHNYLKNLIKTKSPRDWPVWSRLFLSSQTAL